MQLFYSDCFWDFIFITIPQQFDYYLLWYAFLYVPHACNLLSSWLCRFLFLSNLEMFFFFPQTFLSLMFVFFSWNSYYKRNALWNWLISHRCSMSLFLVFFFSFCFILDSFLQVHKYLILQDLISVNPIQVTAFLFRCCLFVNPYKLIVCFIQI